MQTETPRPAEGPTPADADDSASLDASIERLTFGASRLEEPDAEAPRPLQVRRIVAAVEPSDASRHVLAWAESIARATGARVWIVHAPTPPSVLAFYADAGAWQGVPGASTVAEDMRAAEEAARRVVEEGADRLRKAGVPAEGVLLHGGPPVPAISRFAGEHHADLVILGSHGRGALGRLALGSVADGVKNHTTASVLVAKNDPKPERVLLAVDGSRASKRAAALGLRLARAWRAWPTLVHVLPESLRDALEVADSVRADVRAEVGELPLPEDHPGVEYVLRRGHAPTRILQEAREGQYGLVVLGARGLGGFASLVVGSVSGRVAHGSEASVLIVKGPLPPRAKAPVAEALGAPGA